MSDETTQIIESIVPTGSLPLYMRRIKCAVEQLDCLWFIIFIILTGAFCFSIISTIATGDYMYVLAGVLPASILMSIYAVIYEPVRYCVIHSVYNELKSVTTS